MGKAGSLQCPNCGDIFPVQYWLNGKSIYGAFYLCPSCQSKHHWQELIPVTSRSQ
jgi:predicted RNA-binding Zn-ribbon protein involved in translation (DUF1610 family)